MKTVVFITAVACTSLAATPVASAIVSFDWSSIGHPNNPNDPRTNFGSVQYSFRMSKTEVTVAQYTEFLNNKARNDSYNGPDSSLYNSDMANNIIRTGSQGAYEYSPAEGREHRPVTHVSFIDAMRFSNWLHNGQGSSDTETGAYTISDGLSETRSNDARYFIPSDAEWYKAAFFQPAKDGGDTDNYWLYPTQSNSGPVAGADGNFDSILGDTADVGSYDSNYFGLFDMAGNVLEFTERVVAQDARAIRGGAWDTEVRAASLSNQLSLPPEFHRGNIGFRIAAPIPAPGFLPLLGTGAIFSLRRRRASTAS